MSSRSYRWCRRMAAAALAAILPTTPAWALSFDDALQLAEQRAPSLAAQAAKAEAARQSALAAGALPDPKLALGIQNLPIEGEARWSVERDFMTMQMVGIVQEVPNHHKRRAQRALAQATVERSEAERRIAQLTVRRAVAQAWIALYTVERKLALLPALEHENRLLADVVRAQIAGRLAPAADAVTPGQAAAELAERQDELIRWQRQARAALKRWIGPAGDDALTGTPPHWTIDAAQFSARLHHHPELSAYEPMTREAEAALRAAIADKRPDWSWEVDYQHRPEFGDMVTLQVMIDLPVFAGSRQNPRIAAKRAELTQLEAEREALRLEHAQQLEDDLAEYQRLSRAVTRSATTWVPLAEQKRALTLASYRSGQGGLASVLAARRELIEARFKQIDLEGLRALTAARLHFAYGEVRP